jgi:hypothetical protein
MNIYHALAPKAFFGGELEIYICSLIFNCSIYIWGYRYINNANDAISDKIFYLLNCYKNNNNRELHLLFCSVSGLLIDKNNHYNVIDF